MNINRLSFYSLTSLALIASHSAYAEQLMTVPTLEGGLTAMIGTFYTQASADNVSYGFTLAADENNATATATNVTADYQWGIEAELGYVFDDTANGIELSYRNVNPDGSNSSINAIGINTGFINAETHASVDYDFNAADLLISQFLDIGDQMQMRLLGGLSYVNLKQNTHSVNDYSSLPEETNLPIQNSLKSTFNGWGPRIGVDTRYDFGQGFGIVGGGSVAYYLGELEVSSTQTDLNTSSDDLSTAAVQNNMDSHNTTNIRANLGIDYVYFFDNDEHSTLGLELGYQVDFYDDVLASLPSPTILLPYDLTFSGPYLNLKGVF